MTTTNSLTITTIHHRYHVPNINQSPVKCKSV